ncbi:unnamed protein product [Trichobilharzia szidati]|nr:unnamed protein product [Trichobilharzia szidati]
MSVLITELLLFAAVFRMYRSLKASGCLFLKQSHFPLWLLFAFNFGLFIVDHIHFQYNGFMFGILLLSMAYMIEENYLVASLLFTILLNFKHIFMYTAPAYFVHILMNYCLGRREFSSMINRFIKVGSIVLIVMASSFGYFIYTDQMKQVLSRLFPFTRGLCHAYWAPNFWSLYNFMDKVLDVLDDHFLHKWPQKVTSVASMTGGLVENVKHVILPNILPSHTALLSLLFMMPSLCVSVRRSRFFYYPTGVITHTFLKSVILTTWSCFMFGWHVHEKAVLMFLLPLNLFTLTTGEHRFLTFYVSTLGYYSLIPLIPTNAELPAVVSTYLAHTCIHWLILFRVLPANHNTTTTSTNEKDKNKSIKPVKQSKLSQMIQFLGCLHLWGLVLLFLLTKILLPITSLGQRLPYLPLMLTSVYTAFGLFCAFFIFMWPTTTSTATATTTTTKEGWGPRKLWDRLFARAYLIDDLVVSKYSAPIFRLRMNRLRDNLPVPTEVNYFCLSQSEVQYFMISTQSTVSVDQTGFFNHNCTYNEITKVTTCIPLKTVSTTTTTSLTPSICNWHNSFTFPPDVTYSNNICSNVVLKVDYKFVYSNGSIVKAIGQAYLANLPVTTSEVTYYQEYSVKFIHTTEVDNEVSTKLPSHLYGYEMNDLLVVGKVTSSATQRFLVQTDNETNILSGTVKAGVDMLCDNAVKDQFKFGINVASSCRVLLGLNDFANCEKLRSLILARLNQFIPSEVIAVYPQALNTLPEDWVFIQRKDPPIQTSNKMQNSSLIGICPNISSTIYLKIIYAIQGELQGIPLKQIISASIEYSQENWQLMCDTSNYPSLCRSSNISPSTQNFYLTTVIMFSDISSPSDEVLNSTRNCDLDTCWNDAFYAWTGLHKLYQQTGKIEQTFEIGVTLGISSLVLIIFFITRPFF